MVTHTVGYRVPAKPLRFELWVRVKIFPLPIHVPTPRRESKLHDKHKGHKVYTSSGHRCGVIPYCSLWCGGLPHGLMMNNTKGEQPREGLLLSWWDELLG